MNLKDLIRLADILTRLQRVERRMYVRGKGRRENDLEHSFQLAFFTWYILEVTGMKLDQGKAIKYALIHDLVEAYAGDAPFYFKTKADERKKKMRESAAVKRITREFPEFKIGPKYLGNYVHKRDREAKFVSAVDKFLPVLSIYLDGGRSWKKFGVDFETLVKNKREKVSRVTQLSEIFEELVKHLERNKKKLFGNKKRT